MKQPRTRVVYGNISKNDVWDILKSFISSTISKGYEYKNKSLLFSVLQMIFYNFKVIFGDVLTLHF